MDKIDFQKRIMGKQIKNLRKKRRLSQEKLAELLDVSTGYVSLLERGLRDISLNNLIQLCKILKTTPNELLGILRTGYIDSSSFEFLMFIKNLSSEKRGEIIDFIEKLHHFLK